MPGFFAAKLQSRALIAVRGEEARGFLQGLVSNDIEKVGAGRSVYAALLTPQGKFLFAFLISEYTGGLVLETDAARADQLIKRLTTYKLRAKIEIGAVSGVEVVALWRPLGGVREAVGEGEDAAPSAGALPDPRLAALGWRAHVPTGGFEHFAKAHGARVATEKFYHRHRIGLGVPDEAMDLDPEQMFLLDANFEELNGVDFKKGCYVGQELTARMKHRGTARRRMLPVKSEADLPGVGTAVVDDTGREVGELRGSVGDVGLAVFRLDRLAEAKGLKAGDVAIEVTVPGYDVTGWGEPI